MKIRGWLFRLLFRAEWLELFQRKHESQWFKQKSEVLSEQLESLGKDLEQMKRSRDVWMGKCAKLSTPPLPAKFKLDGGLPPEVIAQRLSGNEKTPVIQAIVAHLSAKIVFLSDKATDAPRGQQTLRDGTVLAAFGAAEREHLSGQTWGVAEVLAEIQQLTAPQVEEKEEAKQ